MNEINPYASPTPESSAAPLVYAELFRGVVTTQFVDRFYFFVPEMAGMEARIERFYTSLGTPVAAREPLTFQRGNLWATLLGPEQAAKQRIVVNVSEVENRVNVDYHIQMILPLRMRYHSQQEVTRLAWELGAIRRDAT